MPSIQMEKTEIYSWIVAVSVSVVALSLIGLASRRALPMFLVPPISNSFADTIPHINAGIISIALITDLLGYRAIKNRRITRHRNLMVFTAVLFFLFLSLYLLRMSNIGLTEFPGGELFYIYLYLPFLLIHMVLASVCIPLVIYCLTIALYLGRNGVSETMHPRIGNYAVSLWGISFVFGLMVYLMLHHAF